MDLFFFMGGVGILLGLLGLVIVLGLYLLVKATPGMTAKMDNQTERMRADGARRREALKAWFRKGK